MKYIVSYSGGLGSFMSAYLTIQKFGKENVELIFTDTKTEDEDLYRFLTDTQKALDVPLVTIADGRNIWELAMDLKFQSNSRVDNCSHYLKRALFKRHMKKNYKVADTTIVFGIDWREAHRMGPITKNWKPWNVYAPLTEGKLTREDVLDVLDYYKIDPPRLYEMGFPHNNCGGFCVKTGQKQMKMLLDKMPERYRWHEEQQEKLFTKIGKRHGFIRKTVNGELQYMGLKEFRESVEKGEKVEMWNQEGCGCFT